MNHGKDLVVRWTVGDVSSRGLEALGLSVRGAITLFGPNVTYVVSVNSIETHHVQERLGDLATCVLWHRAEGQVPAWLEENHLDSGYAEGVAWKFAPVRLFPRRYELALDNDVILWELPPSIQEWLAAGDSMLIAEDVRPAYGQFAQLCPDEGRNSGIRGVPPGFSLETEMKKLLRSHPARLTSELDEQGLQVAVLTRYPHKVVTLEEVSICSPTPPHLPYLGRCGAHFVGVNARTLPWEWEGRAGEQYFQEHWDRWRPELRMRVRSGGGSGSAVNAPTALANCS